MRWDNRYGSEILFLDCCNGAHAYIANGHLLCTFIHSCKDILDIAYIPHGYKYIIKYTDQTDIKTDAEKIFREE
jgi:hypothetical protein